MARVSSLIAYSSWVVVGLVSVRAAPPGVSHIRPVPVNDQLPNQEQIQALVGTILSQNGGMFALQDDGNKMLYGLDNQVLAAKGRQKSVGRGYVRKSGYDPGEEHRGTKGADGCRCGPGLA